MPTRRAVLTTTGACTVVLAGCGSVDEALDQAADPAAVGEEALADTAFEHAGRDEQTYEETLTAGGERRDARLTNWTNRYTVSVPSTTVDAARVALFTTPTVTIAGQSANPFAQFDEARLVKAMVERVDTGPVEAVEAVGQRTVTLLGADVTVTEFDARTQQDGVQLRLHLADRTHEGDLFVLFGLHPALLALADDIDTLARGTLHPAAAG